MSFLKYMKYVVGKFTENGDEFMIVFPSQLSHNEVFDNMKFSIAVSAGQIKMENGRVSCYGSSMTLHVSSREFIDTNLFKKEFIED